MTSSFLAASQADIKDAECGIFTDININFYWNPDLKIIFHIFKSNELRC